MTWLIFIMDRCHAMFTTRCVCVLSQQWRHIRGLWKCQPWSWFYYVNWLVINPLKYLNSHYKFRYSHLQKVKSGICPHTENIIRLTSCLSFPCVNWHYYEIVEKSGKKEKSHTNTNVMLSAFFILKLIQNSSFNITIFNQIQMRLNLTVFFQC